jgi:hypothetical protein
MNFDKLEMNFRNASQVASVLNQPGYLDEVNIIDTSSFSSTQRKIPK